MERSWSLLGHAFNVVAGTLVACYAAWTAWRFFGPPRHLRKALARWVELGPNGPDVPHVNIRVRAQISPGPPITMARGTWAPGGGGPGDPSMLTISANHLGLRITGLLGDEAIVSTHHDQPTLYLFEEQQRLAALQFGAGVLMLRWTQDGRTATISLGLRGRGNAAVVVQNLERFGWQVQHT